MIGTALELLQQIVDDAEAGDNYGLDAWHLVVRTELIDKTQEFLSQEADRGKDDKSRRART